MSARDGDRLVLWRRFEEAADTYDDERDLHDLLRLCIGWGRYRAVKRLRERMPGVMSDAAWRTFLFERALPAVPWRVERGEPCLDEGALQAIAHDLGIAPVHARAAMVNRLPPVSLRNHAKRATHGGPYVYDWEVEWDARATLEAAIPDVTRVVQRGDFDDPDPKIAHLAIAGPVVVKENLHLPLDWSDPAYASDEAAMLRAAAHPGVVRLLGLRLHRRHELMVLPLLAGTHPAPGADAVAIAAALADTLAALHARGVLYLDLKPKNVIVGDGVTLIDFAIARQIGAATEVCTLPSTPRYVPPEIGKHGRATAASDVFQLGVVLYELLTGLHPFAGAAAVDDDVDHPGALATYALANLHDPPALGAVTDVHLRELLAAMLARDPAIRPAAGEVNAALLSRL